MGLRARFLMPNRGGEAAAEGYIAKVLGYSPIAYWPLNEASGSDAICQVDSPAQDGTHVGVTLGETGIGDGETCPLYDGVDDDTTIGTATFRNAFNGAEGTVLIWAKVFNVGVWSDGAGPRTAINIAYDGTTNRLKIEKSVSNNQLIWAYEAGNVYKEVAQGAGDIDWMVLGLTWSATADEMKAYKNGAQVGATQNGLGVWAGVPVALRTVIGDRDTRHIDPWHGWLAHGVIWDTPLTPAEILDLSTI